MTETEQQSSEGNETANENTENNQAEISTGAGNETAAQKTGNPEREWVDPAIDPPEKVKERLDFLYGKVKKTEREQNEWRRLAADQAAVIEELRQATGQVVNHLSQKNFADNEANLEKQMIAALQKGDTDTYVAAQAKLIDLKASQKLAAQRIQPQQQRQQTPPNSAAQMAAQGNMPYEQQTMINAWQGEQDERGKVLRPWAENSGTANDPDPDYIKAVVISKNVFTSPETAHLTLNQKLAEIDKRMGVKKNSGGQNVMGGSLTGKGKTGRITLSPQIEKMAVRTKFGGPKAKSDAEHIEAYRKQIEKVRNKGVR